MHCENHCRLVTLYGYTRVLLCTINLVFFLLNNVIITKPKSLIRHVIFNETQN